MLAARKTVSSTIRDAEAEALTSHLCAVTDAGATVCAYVPVGTEPGSLALLDTLSRAGTRVLLPVAVTEDGIPQPLHWGEYRPGGLVRADFGLKEPAGPHLPPATLAEAAIVIVPALAVDRRGVRLGRGAGFYDRSLPLRQPGARLIAVVRDDEVLDALPADEHDVLMTHAVTPGRGVIALG